MGSGRSRIPLEGIRPQSKTSGLESASGLWLESWPHPLLFIWGSGIGGWPIRAQLQVWVNFRMSDLFPLPRTLDVLAALVKQEPHAFAMEVLMDEKIEEGDPRKSVVNARAVAAASKILGLDKPGSSSAEVLGEGPPGEGDEQSAPVLLQPPADDAEEQSGPVLLQPPAEDAEMKPEDDAKMEPEDAEMKHEDEDMDMKPPEGADAVPRLLWQPCLQ